MLDVKVGNAVPLRLPACWKDGEQPTLASHDTNIMDRRQTQTLEHGLSRSELLLENCAVSCWYFWACRRRQEWKWSAFPSAAQISEKYLESIFRHRRWNWPFIYNLSLCRRLLRWERKENDFPLWVAPHFSWLSKRHVWAGLAPGHPWIHPNRQSIS